MLWTMKMKICISDKDVLQINWIIIANHQQLSNMWLTPDNVNTTRWPRKNVKPFRMSPFFFWGNHFLSILFFYIILTIIMIYHLSKWMDSHLVYWMGKKKSMKSEWERYVCVGRIMIEAKLFFFLLLLFWVDDCRNAQM